MFKQFNQTATNSEPFLVISNEDLTELIRQSERIRAVERLLTTERYTTIEDVKAILGIETNIEQGEKQ